MAEGDTIIIRDEKCWYFGREAVIKEIETFGHIVVLTVIIDGNISRAIRDTQVEKVAA